MRRRRQRAEERRRSSAPSCTRIRVPAQRVLHKAPLPSHGMFRSLNGPFLYVVLLHMLLPRGAAFVAQLPYQSHVACGSRPWTWTAAGRAWESASHSSLGATRVADETVPWQDEGDHAAVARNITEASAGREARLARKAARRRQRQLRVEGQGGAHEERGNVATRYMLPSPTEASLRTRDGPRSRLGARGHGESAAPGLTPPSRPHTVDLYVPSADLDVMLDWADRLPPALDRPGEAAGSGGGSSLPSLRPRAAHQLVWLDKEQRLLALAQMVMGMEKVRAEMVEKSAPGEGARGITTRMLAARLGLSPEEAAAFYKLGLRARSYILVSMHSLIAALARKYGATFGVDEAELVQEGYRGAMQALERYDRGKAEATGATFRAFSYFYVMSAMITAARKELHLDATPSSTRNAASMRLPPGTQGRGDASFLLPAGTAGALPAAASGLGGSRPVSTTEIPPELLWKDVKAKEDDGEWKHGAEEGEEEDPEEAAEAALYRRPLPRPGRRPRLGPMRRVTRMGPAQEVIAEAVGAGKQGAGARGDLGVGGRRAELFGVDPETTRPAYEIVDESKRAWELGMFLRRAAQELSPQDMEVLSLLYGLKGHSPLSRPQVARKLGLSTAVVSKSERRALKKLREMLNIGVVE